MVIRKESLGLMESHLVLFPYQQHRDHPPGTRPLSLPISEVRIRILLRSERVAVPLLAGLEWLLQVRVHAGKSPLLPLVPFCELFTCHLAGTLLEGLVEPLLRYYFPFLAQIHLARAGGIFLLGGEFTPDEALLHCTHELVYVGAAVIVSNRTAREAHDLELRLQLGVRHGIAPGLYRFEQVVIGAHSTPRQMIPNSDGMSEELQATSVLIKGCGCGNG